MVRVEWIQHPVGHGGFHTAHLQSNNGETFNWIYDCGSRRTKRFDTYLFDWVKFSDRTIDWLFISHFDLDHVSGLDRLMSHAVIKNVMVPYVNVRELAYLFLHELSIGNVSPPIVDLFSDPASYFLDRGADRVIFLRGGGPEEGDGEPLPELPPEDRHLKVTVQPVPRQPDGLGWRSSKFLREHSVGLINGGLASIQALGRSGHHGLHLVAYCAPLQPARFRGLIADLQKLVGKAAYRKGRPGLGRLAYAIAHHARTTTGRAQLRKTYSHYAGSSNRSSLSLLSLPIMSSPSSSHWHVWPGPLSCGNSDDVAWLNTGDAELLARSDLNDWSRRYSGLLDKVRVLALPHHGSDRNSDDRLQALCPNARFAVHVNSRSKKHPGPNVVLSAGSRLDRVTEDRATLLAMTFSA